MENKISVVIPVKAGSKNGNIELKYSIRSLVLNLNFEFDIIVVSSEKVKLNGLKFIHFKDDKSSMYKERNIYRKILAACNNDVVSDDFIFTNDDIFLTEKIDSISFYHKGELQDTMNKNTGDYRKSLNHTRKFLINQNKPTVDFDTHFPIIYNKQKFIDTFVCKELKFDQPFGYVIKSLYCNMNGIEGEYGGDCKIQHKMNYNELRNKIAGKKFFSTSDGSINQDMIRLLDELYPLKSKYES